MELPEFNNAEPASPQGSFVEQRRDPRFTLLIRSAKLACESGEFLCVVRDVSSSGARLRLFHPVPADEHLELELSTGDRFAIQQVWENGSHVGFRFADPIDVERFVAEVSPYPKRPIRLCLEFPATITADGETYTALVRDLSREGAQIKAEHPLPIGQRLTLKSEGLPETGAAVCWRRKPSHGLAFDTSFSFEELARLAFHLQTAAPHDGMSADQTELYIRYA